MYYSYYTRPTEDAFAPSVLLAQLRERIEANGGPRPWPPSKAQPITRPRDQTRRQRSLRTCHRPAIDPDLHPVKDTGAYVPEMSARIDNDANVSNGARRCARKLAEEIYRRNREGRSLEITVTYLMKALGTCRRTVQRYLRSLERAGYIRVEVVQSERARMCVGLVVHLLAPLFPKHHQARWPKSLGNPGATVLSQNQRFHGSLKRIPVEEWALRCMDGVFRSLRMTLGPLAPPDLAQGGAH